MSIEIISKQIKKFLSSNTPEVLSIKGKWGIGKTFLWNKLIKENKDKISLQKYSYVSLFGVNSLEQLKVLIFENMLDKKIIGEKPSIDTFNSNRKSLLKSLGGKSVSLLKFVPWIKNFVPILDSLLFLSVSNIIICLDDFERKGDITSKEILSLISLLKEQKNCKVVLIFNEDELRDKDEYKIFREKVIDVELLFDLAPAEAADIVLDKDIDVYKKLKNDAVKLGITNIRILKKLERLAFELEGLLSQFHAGVLQQALHTLILFTWSFYSVGEKIPLFDDLKNVGQKIFGIDDKREDENNKAKVTLLREYGYCNTDSFDLVIANAVDVGYINEKLLLDEAKKLEEQITASRSTESYNQAWEVYRNSFDANEAEVIETIYESFKNNYKYVSPYTLDQTVRVFRRLNEHEKADELIEFYINNRKDEYRLFNLANDPFSADIADEKLINKFRAFYESSKYVKTVKEILQGFVQTKNLSQEDREILMGASDEEYYNFFKQEHGQHLQSLIENAGVQVGHLPGFQKALERIGSESALNAMRISSLGIKLANDETRNG